MEYNLQELFNGAKINWFKRMCDLIMLDFSSKEGKNFSLHILTFMRIFAKDRLIVSSWDMYRKGKKSKKKFKYDCPNSTMYDDEIEENNEILCSVAIKSVALKNKDLYISLENGVRIEILIDAVKLDENESEEEYRVFDYNTEYLIVDN